MSSLLELQSARLQGLTHVVRKVRWPLASYTTAFSPSSEMKVYDTSHFFVVVLNKRTSETDGNYLNSFIISTAFGPPGWRKGNETRRFVFSVSTSSLTIFVLVDARIES